MRRLIFGVLQAALFGGIAYGTGLTMWIAAKVGLAMTLLNSVWIAVVFGSAVGSLLALAWPLYASRLERVFAAIIRLARGESTKGSKRLPPKPEFSAVVPSGEDFGEGEPPTATIKTARWDSAQTIAWIASRDDSKIDEIKTVEIKRDGAGWSVQEAAEALALRRQLGLSEDLTLDDAATEIQLAARKGEITARGRRVKDTQTENIDAAEWIGHKLNGYVGKIYRDSDRNRPTPIWIDVTFHEQEIKKKWPAQHKDRGRKEKA